MIAGLLLAAGGASRFGSQKLVEQVGGEPIVHRAAAALASATEALFVVVGSEADRVRGALDGLDATILVNAEWSLGLSSSLRRGIDALPAVVDAAVVTLGDQPGVDPAVIRAVVSRWRETEQPIVAARYRGIQSHPVLFARSVFVELVALTGDRGAKALIGRSAERVAYVDVDAPPAPDIDTPDDLGTRA